jgi:uncharacterized ParB-like nuclease family protein
MEQFDTLFDYTPVKAGLTAERGRVQELLDQNNTELASLQNATPYVAEPVVAARINTLQSENARNQLTITKIDAVLAEITTVETLTAEAKGSLYYFYTVVEVNKTDFMAKMLFNHASALANSTIIALQADTVTESASKVAVAKLIYQSYNIAPEYVQQITSVYRYA